MEKSGAGGLLELAETGAQQREGLTWRWKSQQKQIQWIVCICVLCERAGGVHTGMLPYGELRWESAQNRSAFRRDLNSAEMSSKLPGPDGATYGSEGAQGWISWAPSWDGDLSLGTMSQQMSQQLLEGISNYSHLHIHGCCDAAPMAEYWGGVSVDFVQGNRASKLYWNCFNSRHQQAGKRGFAWDSVNCI